MAAKKKTIDVKDAAALGLDAAALAPRTRRHGPRAAARRGRR